MDEKEKTRTIELLRERIRAVPGRAPDSVAGPLGSLGRSDVRETPAGPVMVIRRETGEDELYGRYRLADFLELSPHDVAYATGVDAAAKTRLSEALFFDIETSAHPDGGDFAFLIGAGRFEGTTFVTDQIFCRDPGEEASSLRVLNKMTDACGWVVTFNGRGFDVPFVANRMRAHRLETDLVMRPHVDLLDPSRKLFKGAFKNCRLLTLEREVVGVRRKRDIPSGMIPGRYGEFLAAGDAAMLRETFDHNHYDVATMAGLILGITRLVHDGEPDAARLPGRVAQLVGQWHVRHGNPERAIPFFESVDGENPNARHDALRDLATIFKKAGRLDKAAVCYETMIADQEALDRFDVWPYEELAKYLERTANDLAGARNATVRAIARCPLHRGKTREDLMRRRDRLSERIQTH